MAKVNTPSPKPPASAPGAASVRSYRVNWLFQGFREEDLHEGDVVKATEEEAAPFLGKALTLHEDEA